MRLSRLLRESVEPPIPTAFTGMGNMGSFRIQVLDHEDMGDCIKILTCDEETMRGQARYYRYRAGFLEYEDGIGNRKVLNDREIRTVRGGFHGVHAHEGQDKHALALAAAKKDYETLRPPPDNPLLDFYIDQLTPVY